VWVFDNATTHTKRAEGALSAQYMPKSTCKWGVEVNLWGFMDAYEKGLSGKQAAWASKKYRGHCVLPETILNELENAKIL
jgi:hypothetical protein